MKKATHVGTCQVCGSSQMLPAGVLSKHGYTVDGGFFNGVCPGAGHAPLEQERALADEVAADLLRQSAELAAKRDDVYAGKRFPRFARNGLSCLDRKNRWTEIEVPYADAPARYQADAVRILAANLDNGSRQAASISAAITKRAEQTTGIKPLTPRADEAARKQVAVGSRVKIYGKSVEVVAIETRTVWGIGPHINGQSLPHAIYVRASDGKRCAYPVRLIRQAAIE